MKVSTVRRYVLNVESPEQAMKEIQAYIDYWNNGRIQARLKYRSPKEIKEAISHHGV